MVAVTVAEQLVLALVHARGIGLSGDQPHYLVIAEALTHFDVHPLAAYHHDQLTRQITSWPAVLSAGVTHTFAGPHGTVSVHDIGLPVLLAPFFAIGGVTSALLGYQLVLAVGFVALHRRASGLAGLGGRGQVVFALAMAGPALWLAATQLYPDLIAGVVLAVAVVEIAVAERSRRLGYYGAAVVGVGLGLLPWLHQKYIVAAALGLVAFVVVAVRGRLPVGRAVAAVAVAVVLLALKSAYNAYFLGHVLGLPQPPPDLGPNGAAAAIALVVDRQQGLAVQVPTVVLGIAGMWFALRSVAVATVAALAAVGSVLVLNATYTSLQGTTAVDAFGNLSFAGRYGWSAVPVLLAFAPMVLVRIEPHARRLAAVGAAVVLASLAEWVPVAADHHQYFNAAMPPYAPWDPTLYPGWWGWADRVLPVMYGFGRSLHSASTWWGIALVAGVLVASVAVLVVLARPGPLDRRRVGTRTAVVAGLLVAVAVAAPTTTLPAAAAQWTPAAIGSPWTSPRGAPLVTAPIVLTATGAGTFAVTVQGSLTGPRHAAATVTVFFTPSAAAGDGRPSGPVVAAHVVLRSGARRQTSVATVDAPWPAVAAVSAGLGPSQRLAVTVFRLDKVRAAPVW